VAGLPHNQDAGQFWILSSTVDTVDDEGETVGDAHVLAPDGTAIHVVWRTPGDYRFEESSFSGTHPLQRDRNPLMRMDIPTLHASLVDQTMPGLRAKWEEWRASRPE
jgi:hypothetical protein